MRTEHLDPARSIIARLGGVNVVAEATGKSRTRVFRWMYSPERGGTGGLIPQREIPGLLEFAKGRRVALKPADFLPAAQSTVTTVSVPDGAAA